MADVTMTGYLGPQGQVLRDALTACRPANVINNFVARMGEPFQVDPNPPHMAPLRYPDLFTIPGVLGDDPNTAARKAAVSYAENFDEHVDPVPMEVDWQANMGTTQLVEVGAELLSRQELIKRAFAPRPAPAPSPWDFQR